jgi:hypothetical protein
VGFVDSLGHDVHSRAAGVPRRRARSSLSQACRAQHGRMKASGAFDFARRRGSNPSYAVFSQRGPCERGAHSPPIDRPRSFCSTIIRRHSCDGWHYFPTPATAHIHRPDAQSLSPPVPLRPRPSIPAIDTTAPRPKHRTPATTTSRLPHCLGHACRRRLGHAHQRREPGSRHPAPDACRD